VLVVDLFIKIILPVFLLIGLGVGLDRLLRLDLTTLSRLNFFVFVPAFVFVRFIEAELGDAEIIRILLFTATHTTALFVLAWVAFSSRRFDEKRPVLALGACTSNCGNFGIPFIALAFPGYVAAATAVAAITVMTHSIFLFTFGFWLLEGRKSGPLRALRSLAGVPVIYAIALGFACRWLGAAPPPLIHEPLSRLSDGLIPVALLTIGVQISRCSLPRDRLPLHAVGAMRLAVSPALAAVLVLMFGFAQPLAAILIAMAGLPAAINVYILAAQCRRGEDLASQIVLWTTLLSAFSLAVLLAVIR
jgi:predicted permease